VAVIIAKKIFSLVKSIMKISRKIKNRYLKVENKVFDFVEKMPTFNKILSQYFLTCENVIFFIVTNSGLWSET